MVEVKGIGDRSEMLTGEVNGVISTSSLDWTILVFIVNYLKRAFMAFIKKADGHTYLFWLKNNEFFVFNRKEF